MADVPNYARMVPFAEIEGQGFNLNLPRYVDGGRRADAHDIAAHLLGGMPEADVEALADHWAVLPQLRTRLFEPGDRPGPLRPTLKADDVAAAVQAAPEFGAFRAWVAATLAGWREAQAERLRAVAPGDQPKALIGAISEDLLARFMSVSTPRLARCVWPRPRPWRRKRSAPP